MKYEITTKGFTERFTTLNAIDTNNISEVAKYYIMNVSRAFKSTITEINNGSFEIKEIDQDEK